MCSWIIQHLVYGLINHQSLANLHFFNACLWHWWPRNASMIRFFLLQIVHAYVHLLTWVQVLFVKELGLFSTMSTRALDDMYAHKNGQKLATNILPPGTSGYPEEIARTSPSDSSLLNWTAAPEDHDVTFLPPFLISILIPHSTCHSSPYYISLL